MIYILGLVGITFIYMENEPIYMDSVIVAIWRKTFQGIGVEGITEQSVENELKAGKCFMYQYDKKDRTVIYIRPRLHEPSQSNIEEVLIRLLVIFLDNLIG